MFLGYINESGFLNLKRFQEFLKAFAENDRNCFLQTMEDEDYMQSKKTRYANAPEEVRLFYLQVPSFCKGHFRRLVRNSEKK